MINVELTARLFSVCSACFFLAGGAWSDLLLIRTFLTNAYIFLICFHFEVKQQHIELWILAFICLYVHGSHAVRLFMDERPVTLDNEEQEMLWRFFFRYSGVTKLLFKKHIGHRFELKYFDANEPLDPANFFYIVLDGSVKLDVEMNGHNNPSVMTSGDAGAVKHLHSVLTRPMLPLEGQKVTATTMSACRLYCCTAQNMKGFTTCRAVKDASQGLLTAVLSDIAVKNFFLNQTDVGMQNQVNPNNNVNDELSPLLQQRNNNFISPLFQPLQDFEIPKHYLPGGAQSLKDIPRQFLHIIRQRLLLPWPLNHGIPGLRQVGSLPIPKCERPTHRNKAASTDVWNNSMSPTRRIKV